MYVITNGRLITEDTVLHGYDLLIEEDRITKMAPKGEIKFEEGMEKLQVLESLSGHPLTVFISISS